MTSRLKTFALRLGAMASATFWCATLPACGKTLDVGRDPRPGCEAETSSLEILSSFESLPDFSPSSLLIVGEDVYVGGLSFPGRTFDADARDVGRVYRFPLAGGPPTEVWRGQWFRPPLRAQGSRIAFVELDLNNHPTFPVFAGVHVWDAARGKMLDVPNLPERYGVGDFALLVDGVVFASSSSSFNSPNGSLSAPIGPSGIPGDPELPGSPIVRYRFEQGISTEAFVHPTSGAEQLFERDGHAEALYRADGSPSGYGASATPATQLDLAAFAVGDTYGVSLVRRFTEIPRSAGTSPIVSYAVVHADDSSYFVSATSNGSTTTRRYPARLGGTPVSVGGPSYGFPVFDRGEAFFVSFADRSAIRRVDATSSTESPGTEVAFDARRQVFSVAVDACRVAWLSTSTSSPETYRLTVGARP